MPFSGIIQIHLQDFDQTLTGQEKFQRASRRQLLQDAIGGVIEGVQPTD
jgi:hypothetical protein